MATKQEMLEAGIDILVEIRRDGPNVLALCHKIRLAAPDDGVAVGDTRNMKQGVYKDTIVQAIQNAGSTHADVVYEEFHRLAGLRGHTRESFDRSSQRCLGQAAGKGVHGKLSLVSGKRTDRLAAFIVRAIERHTG